MKKGWILSCVMSSLISSAIAQQPALDDYSFTTADPVVGTLVGLKKAKLSGPQAKLFGINGKQQVYFKGKTADQDWYDLTVEGTGPTGKVSATFRVVQDRFNRNGVIAHRGAWKNTGASQNSIASLREAAKLGCFGSEFDVHMTADSGLIVSHDHMHDGVNLETASRAELAALRLKNGETLPSLEEYLTEGMKQQKTRLVLEIKSSKISKERSLKLTEKVIAKVRELKAQGWVDYIAFDFDVCKKVKELDPFAKVAYLNGDKTPEQLAAAGIDGFDYHFSVLKKNEGWIPEAHERKLTVNIWTVNDPELMKGFLAQKADYITTDEPEKLFALKSEK